MGWGGRSARGEAAGASPRLQQQQQQQQQQINTDTCYKTSIWILTHLASRCIVILTIPVNSLLGSQEPQSCFPRGLVLTFLVQLREPLHLNLEKWRPMEQK